MYRWCSYCNDQAGELRLGQAYCPQCSRETDVEFKPNDMLKIDQDRCFRVLNQLSQHADAGMSSVYFVERTDKPDRRAVLKVAKASRYEALLREVTQLQQLSHPNIIRLAYGRKKIKPEEAILNDIQDDQRLNFIALEYMAGGSLKQRLKDRGIFSLEEAYEIVNQVSEALDYAHHKNVVHLDVKPANILFSADDRRVVLSDFGVARQQAELLRTRGRVGTMIYNAPEQFISHMIPDCRVDIYALGLILFEMLTGQNPIQIDRSSVGASTQAKAILGKISAIPNPRTLNPTIPVVVEQVILKAINPDREKRYASAGELAAHLREALQKRKSGWVLGLGAAALIVGAIGLLALIAWFGIFNSVQPSNPYLPLAPSPTLAFILGESRITPTSSPQPGLPSTSTSPSPPAPTSTSASKNPAPTSTLAPTAAPIPARPIPPAQATQKTGLTGEIALVSPANGVGLSGTQTEFQWKWSDGLHCEPLPKGYGFEISIWADVANVSPAGAMDAARDQAVITCDQKTGIRSFTMGDVKMAPGVRDHQNVSFRWHVAVVQIDPYMPIFTSASRIIHIAK